MEQNTRRPISYAHRQAIGDSMYFCDTRRVSITRHLDRITYFG